MSRLKTISLGCTILSLCFAACGSNDDDDAAGTGGKGGSSGKGAAGSKQSGSGGTAGSSSGSAGKTGGTTGGSSSDGTSTGGSANAGKDGSGTSGSGGTGDAAGAGGDESGNAGGSGELGGICEIPPIVYSCSLLAAAQCAEYYKDFSEAALQPGCEQSGGVWSHDSCPRDGLFAYCLNKFPEDTSNTLGAFYYADNPAYQVACGGGTWCPVK